VTTAADATWEVKRLVEQNLRVEQNTLNGSLTGSQTSVILSEPMRSVLEGAEIEIDSELMRVVSVSGQTATVKRGQRGTTATTHADGSNVFVNPRFSVFGILSDMNATLAILEAEGLFKETAVEVTYNPSVSGYDLTGSSTVLDVLEVRWQDDGPDKRFPKITSWSLLRNMNTSDFASGNAIVLDSSANPGRPIRIRYSAPFTRITVLTDDLQSTVGLTASMNDLLWVGAAIRQMEGRDTRRSFLETQLDTRRSSEVGGTAAQQSLNLLRKRFDDRLGEERARLLQRWP